MGTSRIKLEPLNDQEKLLLATLLKLKYRQINPGILFTRNNGFDITVRFSPKDDCTNILIEESFIESILIQSVYHMKLEGNITSDFVVIQDINYITNRIEVEI